MKKGLTEIVFILDRSGSMSGLEEDTIGGFNSMLKKQKEVDGDAFITTVLFDSRIEILHDRENIKEISPMTGKDYVVGGCTALYDAIGFGISHIADIHRYARDEDVPEKTLFIITTDGMENSSREFSIQALKKLIKSKEKLGWEFIFLGANIDSEEVAEGIGIKRERAINYKCDSIGTAVVYDELNSAVGGLRECSAIPTGFGKKIKADYEKRKK